MKSYIKGKISCISTQLSRIVECYTEGVVVRWTRFEACSVIIGPCVRIAMVVHYCCVGHSRVRPQLACLKRSEGTRAAVLVGRRCAGSVSSVRVSPVIVREQSTWRVASRVVFASEQWIVGSQGNFPIFISFDILRRADVFFKLRTVKD